MLSARRCEGCIWTDLMRCAIDLIVIAPGSWRIWNGVGAVVLDTAIDEARPGTVGGRLAIESDLRRRPTPRRRG